jgi:hypothetical protein
MISDPRVTSSDARRRALWLVMVVGFVLHASLCPPDAHAGVLGASARACVPPAAGGPPPSGPATSEADGLCAPPVRPHHPPSGTPQQRTAGSWQAGVGPGCPLPATAADGHTGPGPACPRSSRPPAARSGAGLLIDLCASRT